MPDPRALLLAAAVSSAALGAQDAISVNFRGDGGRAITAVAGAMPRVGWNNVDGGWRGAPIPILTDLGADLGTRLGFLSASDGARFQPPGSGEDAALFDGQIVAADGDAVVTVTGVPYRRYDVFVFVGHGPEDAGRDICVKLDARTVLCANENLAAYVDPVQFRLVEAGAPTVALGNTAVVRGCMNPEFTLTLAPAPGSLLPGRSGIAGFQIVDVSADTDSDGLEDGWERHWFGNLLSTPTEDPDGDSLSNLEEQERHCNPVLADTDGDGARDDAEVARGTDPRNRDTDGDGLRDGVETGTGVFVSASDTGTDPLLADSDQDRAVDGAEVRRGANPNALASRPSMPNVIVILVDDLGSGDLGAYGNTLIRTPHIDRLAADGVRFTQFYAGSAVCAPTRCTLLTGQHTGHAQVRTNIKPPLRAGTRTLAHMLREQGYATASIGKWGFGEVMTTGHPRNQGFDEFFGFLDQFHAHWYYPSFLWRNDQQVLYPTNNGVWGPTNAGQIHAHDELTAAAFDFVDRNRSNPFLLMLNWTIPHVSLQEPPHSDPARRALGETAIDEFYSDVTWPEPNANFPSTYYTSHARPRRAYASMISALDRDLGLLRTKLEQHGIARDTLILFTSDNGGTACCGVDDAFFASNGGLRGSKSGVYEGGIRVPCIAWWPGGIPAGRVSGHVGAMWDVFATLGELVEADVPDDCDGISFLPTLLDRGSQAEHEFLYWEYEEAGLKKAVRYGNWKGVRRGVAGVDPLELYDLATDPAEAADVAASWPQVVAHIDRLMGAAHLPSPYFRGDDEFPLRRNMHIGQGQGGVALAAHFGATGTVLAPFAQDVTTPVEVTVWCKVIDIGNRPVAALLLGDGEDPATHVRFGIDVRQRELFIAHGATRLAVSLPAEDSPLRGFTLRARLDPATGDVSLREGERTWITGTLPSPPSQISHYGHELVNSLAVFGPIDPPADRMLPRGRYEVFGAGCLGTAGRPTLWLLSEPPALGHPLTILVGGLPMQQGLPVTGLLGSSNTMWGTVPLPLALDNLGLTGCALHVTPDVIVPLVANDGTAHWVTPIPASTSLLGGAFHQQVMVLDLGANPGGFTVSNGGSATIGAR